MLQTPTQQWLYSIRGLVGDAPAGQTHAKKQSQHAQLCEPEDGAGETGTSPDALNGGCEVPESAQPAAAYGSPARKLNYLQRNILAVKQAPAGHRVMPSEIKLVM